MLRSAAAAAAAFFSLAGPCAAMSVTFYGSLTSYEVMQQGTWKSAGGAGPLVLTLSVSEYLLGVQHCAPASQACGSPAQPFGLFQSTVEFGAVVHDPDADAACSPAMRDCAAADRWVISRAAEHEGSFGDQTYRLLSDGITSQWGGTTWSFTGDNWVPDGPISLGALLGLGDAIDGAGSFFFSTGRGGELLDGSYRGTFEITSAYVPAPGTIALLAAGALLMGYRRHRSTAR